MYYRNRWLCRVPEALGKALKILGKHVFCREVLQSVNQLVTESRTLPNAAFGKEAGTRQRPEF
jgi:hypothetical protein